jgi:hypothetical protein
MDFQSPIFLALATAALTAALSWAYAKYMLKDPLAEKVFAKTLLSGLFAATAVVLYVRQFEPVPSLQTDPFFAPMM